MVEYRCELSVNITTMSHGNNTDRVDGIINQIKNPIVANSYSISFPTPQTFACSWTRGGF